MSKAKYEQGEAEQSLHSPGEVKRTKLKGNKVTLVLSNLGVREGELKREHKVAVDQLILDFHLGRTCASAKISLVEGYTDGVDTEDVNVPLRELRAQMASGWITGRIMTSNPKYTGDEQFVRAAPRAQYLNSQNNSQQGRADNRAVKIELVPTPETLSQPFFRVQQKPSDFNRDVTDTCGIVSDDPWRRGKYRIGGVLVRGRTVWVAGSSVLPIWSNEVIYYNTRAKPLRTLLTNIVVHHTSNDDGLDKNERKQQKKKGYAAIGYHFYIDKAGWVYQGRPLEVMGSHAGVGKKAGPLSDPDWGSVGIVLSGNFHGWGSDDPAHEQLKSLRKLIQAVKKEYSINRLLMHKEVKNRKGSTVCPGENLYKKVETIRNDLKMSK